MPIDFPNSPTNGQEFTSGGTTWVYDGTKWNTKTVAAYSNDAAPVGTIVNFAGPVGSIPAGWVACDGSAVSRTTYATLFSTIGTTYGAGNGSTTFNLPDIDGTFGVFIIRWTTTLGVTATDSLYATPVGTMLTWPTTSSLPTGWLRADGSAVSRTTYADLFALIGTAYGTGNGSTTFNLPNMIETGGPVTIIKATLSGGQEPSTVAHAASHVRGGADIIDGDRVQIDYVPTGYVRNSAATGAGATTDLTAHLGGIDGVLATIADWTSYTPSLVTWTLGNGTLTGRYAKVGKTIFLRVSLTIGSTTTTTASAPFITLPVTAASGVYVCVSHLVDSGTDNYFGTAMIATATAGATYLIPQYNVAAANNMRSLSNTTPFTWANGDQYNVGLMIYEAA